MSCMYCDHCGVIIDTDYDCEHFTDDGGCTIEEELNNEQ